MGNVTYNVPRQYVTHKAARYAEYYENEQGTFANVLKQMYSRIQSRYKIITDKNIRRKRQSKIVRDRLREVGLRGLDLVRPESFYVSTLLKPNEKIKVAISGRVDGGAAALLVMTELRILYINVIPLFTTIEEIGFGIVEAVSMKVAQFDATVCLYTGVGNFTFHRVGIEAASNFVECIDEEIEACQAAFMGQTIPS